MSSEEQAERIAFLEKQVEQLQFIVNELVSNVLVITESLKLTDKMMDSLNYTVRDLRTYSEMAAESEKTAQAAIEMIKRQNIRLQEQDSEINQLRDGLTRVLAVNAPAAELLQMYENYREQRPGLTLKAFLENNGAAHRYRAVVSWRSQKRKQKEAGQ